MIECQLANGAVISEDAMPLEDYYCGDDRFRDLAKHCEPGWAACDHKEEFLAAVGELDLAMVLHQSLDQHAVNWLDGPVPVLEGLTPRECLKTEPGRRRVKECLMRMD